MFVNVLMRMLAYELESRSIKDPLRQYFRLCDIWYELARLNGETLPPDIAAIIEEHPFTGLKLPEKEDP